MESKKFKKFKIEIDKNKDRIALFNRICEVRNMNPIDVRDRYKMNTPAPSYDSFYKFLMGEDFDFEYSKGRITVWVEPREVKPQSLVKEPHKTPETSVDVVDVPQTVENDSEEPEIEFDDDDEENPFA
jgi:hypothetical protein